MIITFTMGVGKYVYIASQHIVSIEPAAHGTRIMTVKGAYPVIDSIEIVLAAIKEAERDHR